jgi:hypothetical protein
MKINLFNIVNFGADGGAMFGVIPKAMWSRVYRANENNLITLALRSLVVETDGHVILVDTGWGDKQDEKFFRHLNLHGGDGLAEGLKNAAMIRKHNYGRCIDPSSMQIIAEEAWLKSREGSGFELAFPDALFNVSRVQVEWAVKT